MLKLKILLLSVLSILTGCGNLHSSNVNLQPHINFPEVVKLTYENIEFESLDQDFSIINAEKKKSISFGEIYGEPIIIDIYSNIEESSTSIGLLYFNNQSYLLNSVGYSHDIESIETFNIGSIYMNFEKNLHLVGAIGSSAIGYHYVFYDAINNEWLAYHNWGTPNVIDVDQNGSDEILLQFQGISNNPPDIAIIYWDNSKGLQTTNINDKFINVMKEIDLSKNRISSTLNLDEEALNVVLVGTEEESRTYIFDTLEKLLVTE